MTPARKLRDALYAFELHAAVAEYRLAHHGILPALPIYIRGLGAAQRAGLLEKKP